MRFIDFISWPSELTAMLTVALLTLFGMGIRLLFILVIQRRQQRLNRQIDERLKALIAAYQVLGRSFTGPSTVEPAHRPGRSQPGRSLGEDIGLDRQPFDHLAVEAALSDIILLGTEDHVRLATQAALDLTDGHAMQTQDLIVSLREFIREALDLEPIPRDVSIPLQGPARSSRHG